MAQLFWYALTSSNINRFLKLFHCQNQEKICNKNYKSLKIPPHLKCVATLPGVGGCLIFYLNLVYSHQWGQLDLKISGRKGCPHQTFLLSRNMWCKNVGTNFRFVTNHAFVSQTDRQIYHD